MADQDTVDVVLTLDRVLSESFPEGLAYKVVWAGLGQQGNTDVLHPSSSTTLQFGKQWLLAGTPIQPSPEASKIGIALWSEPSAGAGEGAFKCVGLGEVLVASFGERPLQRYSIELQQNDKGHGYLRVEFGITAQFPGADTAATAPVAAPAAPPPEDILPPPPDGDQPAAPRLLSRLDFRNWVAGVLEEVLHCESGLGSEVGGGELQSGIGEAGEPLLDVLRQLIDDPLRDRDQEELRRADIPVQVGEELLLAAACDVYLHSIDGGHRLGRVLREESAQKLLQLLRLPRQMTRRVFTDNQAATLCALRLAQQHGILKSTPDLRQRRAERKVQTSALVVYVAEETWEEWQETQLDQQLEFEMPLLCPRTAPVAPNGSIDVPALEQLVKSDAAQGCVPCGIISRIGGYGVTAADDLTGLVTLCQQQGLWLHLEGPAVFMLGTDWTPLAPFRVAAQDGQVNLSVQVSEDEVPGLRQLPGFWLFTSGDEAGGWPLPQDSSPEQDLSGIRCSLPGYLRLRSGGFQGVQGMLESRHSEALSLVEKLEEINKREMTLQCKMHTEPQNLWNVRFSVLPAEHPLAGGTGQDQPQVTLERINTINRTLFRMVCGGDTDDAAFEMQDVDGLLWWSYSPASSEMSLPVLENLDVTLSRAGRSMFCVARIADDVLKRLEDIQDVHVIRRSLEHDPLEVCAFRMVPLFYDAQDQLSAKDIEDINAINRSLHAHLIADDLRCAVFSTAENEGVTVVSCSLSSAQEHWGDVGQIGDQVAAAVRWVLRYDPTVQRIESELIQRGIAVAEKELQIVAARNEGQRGFVRSVPLVGGVWDWLAPVAEQDEGLRFDLTTSTLKKEGRAAADEE
eukprot:Hpha_TRINITY_DN18500_c0_g1::TRINITY_DN18500_c0_g1_i1::g.195166::m.195166